MWPFSSRTAERKYVSLMFKATACYASWDPLRPVNIGDYGRLQDDGSFASHGNIFDEGLAAQYKIEKHAQGEDELRYIVSDNGNEISIAPDVNVSLESILEGHIKHKIAFSNGRGALLAMLRPHLTTITYPGRLSRLLVAQRDWKDFVLVSEVYTCHSYARFLTSHASNEVTVGLGASVPLAAAVGVPVNAGGDIDVEWQTDSHGGDWKCTQHELLKKRETVLNADHAKRGGGEDESRPLCYPLFKLVALHRPFGSPVSTVRAFDFELPVALPPWMKDDEGSEEEDGIEDNDVSLQKEKEKVPKWSCRALFGHLMSKIRQVSGM